MYCFIGRTICQIYVQLKMINYISGGENWVSLFLGHVYSP